MTAIASYDPRTGGAGATVPETDDAGLAGTLERSEGAAAQVAAASPAQRRDWLGAVADDLVAHRDELAELADRETALGMTRLTGEVERAAGQLRFYADVAAEGSYLGVSLDSVASLARVNHPLGPVAVFGASNFPFAFGVLGNDTATALAAGCPVVAKAHPAHPLLSNRLGEIAREALVRAGAPEGTFEVVVGFAAGTALVQAPQITAVGFTGSQQAGTALWRLANERETVIPVFAEMGTVNPVVVTPAGAGDVKTVAEGFIGSCTLGQGQFCTKPGLLLAPSGAGLPEAVAAALTAAAPAPVMLTRGIAEAVPTGIEQMTAAGAQVLARVPAPPGGWAAPAAVLTAPLSALGPGSRLLEECFGPVALVCEYADEDELRRALAVLQPSLVATVVSGGDDDELAPELTRLLATRVGRVTHGDWPTGVAVSWSQQHGGPWPATSAPATTSVGAAALDRFVRPVAYQSVPDRWLPPALQQGNPWSLPRRVDGRAEPAPEGQS